MINIEVVTDPRVESLLRRMAEDSLAGHWQPREERVLPLVPFVWKWSEAYSCLVESVSRFVSPCPAA